MDTSHPENTPRDISANGEDLFYGVDPFEVPLPELEEEEDTFFDMGNDGFDDTPVLSFPEPLVIMESGDESGDESRKISRKRRFSDISDDSNGAPEPKRRRINDKEENDDDDEDSPIINRDNLPSNQEAWIDESSSGSSSGSSDNNNNNRKRLRSEMEEEDEKGELLDEPPRKKPRREINRDYNRKNRTIGSKFIGWTFQTTEITVNDDEFVHYIYWKVNDQIIEGFGELKNKGNRTNALVENTFGITDDNIRASVFSKAKGIQKKEYGGIRDDENKSDFVEFGDPSFVSGKEKEEAKVMDMIEELVKNGMRREIEFKRGYKKLSFVGKYMRWFKHCVELEEDADNLEENGLIIEEYEEKGLFDWQKTCYDELMKQGDRNILWIVGKKGNEGKSSLLEYIEAKHDGEAQLLSGSSKKHLAYLLDNKNSIFMVDLAREANLKSDICVFLEDIKNGKVISEHYETTYKRIKKKGKIPKVVVFSNGFPDLHCWSEDRYQIYEIMDGKLVYNDIQELRNIQKGDNGYQNNNGIVAPPAPFVMARKQLRPVDYQQIGDESRRRYRNGVENHNVSIAQYQEPEIDWDEPVVPFVLEPPTD